MEMKLIEAPHFDSDSNYDALKYHYIITVGDNNHRAIITRQ